MIYEDKDEIWKELIERNEKSEDLHKQLKVYE